MIALGMRPAEHADVEILSQIARDAYAKYEPRMAKSPAPVYYDYNEIIAAGHTWVLTADNQVCGMFTMVDQEDHILFRNIAILPPFQGKGIGKFAARFAEQEARRLGRTEVRGFTNVFMPENVPFYLNQGYVETHRSESNGYNFIHFAKTVPAQDNVTAAPG